MSTNSKTWPWVLGFAQRMEAKLDKNRHKGDREGWRGDTAGALLRRLDQETVELRQAIAFTTLTKDDHRRIADEAADVANFAMMLADVAGDLEPEPDALAAEREKVRKLREALEDIADPIARMRAECATTGAVLNGGMAHQLSNDAAWLKAKARAALDKTKEGL